MVVPFQVVPFTVLGAAGRHAQEGLGLAAQS
jgi:hypothetical protein